MKPIIGCALTAFILSAPAFAGAVNMTTERVAFGLTRPVFATYAPSDYTRLFIVEKRGIIKILNLKTGLVNVTAFLNIDGLIAGGTSDSDERGLLGLAFHPDYQTNGHFYVNYTDANDDTKVVRYSRLTADTADAGSAGQVFSINQPQPNHNGGWLGFGPNDGYLYVSTGDGGGQCDPNETAQDISIQKLGKILRVDVDGVLPYTIPPTNPFVGIQGDDEIWAYGLRNPWRPSFDRLTGDLYIADVGQNTWEEVNFQPASSPGGENYGWDCTEGFACPTPVCGGGDVACACADLDLVDPVHVYSHASGCSISGGYVYRGCTMPAMQGTYFFADYCTARIWSFVYSAGVTQLTERTTELDPPGALAIGTITSFGEDAWGEIYICDQGSEVYRIRPADYDPIWEDVDCNLDVGFGDLLGVLSKWGPCDGCPEDIDGDGEVGFSDLLRVLATWGPLV